jgi:uncharacterized membrane protein YraQ (UPF0718 family)
MAHVEAACGFKPKMIAIFVGIITVAIIFIGYLFNFIFAHHLLGA